MTQLPILYSFRRCPYAMRARLAVAYAGIACELREVLLRDKAPAFLEASPSATVPCLVDGEDILDESLDIMIWALGQNDPEGWLDMPDKGHELIRVADGEFKTALDRYKYASRHAEAPEIARAKGARFLVQLNEMLAGNEYLFGDHPSLADMAILPFVRQFAHVDLDWFEAEPWPDLARWLADFKASGQFRGIMEKYPKWQAGDGVTVFGA